MPEPDFKTINDVVKEIKCGPQTIDFLSDVCKKELTMNIYSDITIYFEGDTKPVTLGLESDCCEFVFFSFENTVNDKYSTKDSVKDAFTTYNDINSIFGKKIRSIKRNTNISTCLDLGTCDYLCVDSVDIIVEDGTSEGLVARVWLNVISNGYYSGFLKISQN